MCHSVRAAATAAAALGHFVKPRAPPLRCAIRAYCLHEGGAQARNAEGQLPHQTRAHLSRLQGSRHLVSLSCVVHMQRPISDRRPVPTCSNGGAGAAPPPVAARLRPSLGLLMHATLLVAPQLALHAHLGSLWLNFAIAAGARRQRSPRA